MSTVEEAASQQYSYIVCANKSLPDVHPTSKIIAPLLDRLGSSSGTAIVLLQNGVGIEDDIYDALSRRNLNIPVISGCAWVDATAVDDGKTVTQHGNERLVIGYHKPPIPSAFSETASKFALNHFSDLLVAAGGNVEVSEIDVARWRKVLWYVDIFLVLSRLSHRCIQERIFLNSVYSHPGTSRRSPRSASIACCSSRYNGGSPSSCTSYTSE